MRHHRFQPAAGLSASGKIVLGSILFLVCLAFSADREPPIGRSVDLGDPVRQKIRQTQFLSDAGAGGTTVWESRYGTPGFVRGALTEASEERPEAIAARFLAQNRPLLKLSRSGNDFSLLRTERDDSGNAHVRFLHRYRGLPVWPEDVIVHVDPQGAVYCFNGNYREISLEEVQAAISREGAVRIAETGFPCRQGVEATAELVVYTFHVEEPVLAWKIWLHSRTAYPYRYLVFVDARSGTIVNSIDMAISGRPATSTGFIWNNQVPNGQAVTINTWRDDDGRIYLLDASKPMFPGTLDLDTFRGILLIMETNHTDTSVSGKTYPAFDPDNDNVFDDTSEVVEAGQASYGIGKTYDYFRNTHGRNSIDGAGMGIRVFVNFRSEPKQGLDNAFWDGKEIVLGDGGQVTSNWAGALDLLAHEFTHGVTEYSSNLVYQFESGALNESMSDVFGVCVERANWLIGEGIIRPGQAPALRSMSDPHNGQNSADSPFWQPAHMREFQNYPANRDNGGVHKNSSIPNLAFYHTASAITLAKAEKVWYRGYRYMTQNTDFKGARQAFEQSAIDLYGAGSAELAAVRKAFEDVGISSNTQQPSGSFYLYYPMATSFDHYGKKFQGYYSFTNPQDAETQYNVEEFKKDGTRVASSGSATLSAKAMKYYKVNDATSFVKVTSNKRLIGFGETVTADGRSWACTSASENYSNGVFIPHITYPLKEGWFTLCGVSNVTNVPSSVMYVDNADKVNTLEMNGLNKSLFFDFYDSLYLPIHGGMPDTSRLGGLWGLIANYDLKADKVLEANMVAGEMFGTIQGNSLAALTLSSESSRSLLFSHITSTRQGWWTGIALICLQDDPNPNDAVTTAPIKVTAFSAAGKVLKETITRIPYLGKTVQIADTWKEGNEYLVPEGTVWLLVSYMAEGNYLSGYELFGALNSSSGDTVAGIEAAARVSKKLLFPQVLTGSVDGSPYWTGIAVINPNDSTASLTYRLFDPAGRLVKTASKTVGPNRKDLGLVSDLFGTQNLFGWVEVESSNNITGFAVFSYQDGRSTAGLSPFLGF